MPYDEGYFDRIVEERHAEMDALVVKNRALCERLAATERPMFDLAEYIRMWECVDSLPPRLICEAQDCERTAVVVIQNQIESGEYHHACEAHALDYVRYPSTVLPLPSTTEYVEALRRHAVNAGLLDATG